MKLLRFSRLRIFAVCLAKDEEDIIGYQLEHLIQQGISHILLIDNLSKDNTKVIAKKYSKEFPVTILDDSEFAYYQARKMNYYISLAYSLGADFILPVDIDEIWHPIDSSFTLKEAIREYSGRNSIFECKRHNFIPSSLDGNEKNPFLRMKHFDPATRIGPKVCFTRDKSAILTMGNHEVHNHKGSRIGNVIGINHYPYRSFEQFKRKLQNGRLVLESTNLPEGIGVHWRTLGALNDDEIAEKWAEFLSTPTMRFE